MCINPGIPTVIDCFWCWIKPAMVNVFPGIMVSSELTWRERIPGTVLPASETLF